MNKRKQKGYKLEHYLEIFLRENGIEAMRLGQANQPDILIKNVGTLEAKCEKGLGGIYRRIGDSDFLALKWQSPKARNKPILVLMSLGKFLELLKGRQTESIEPKPCEHSWREIEFGEGDYKEYGKQCDKCGMVE